jgi:hypothetical protein
MAKTGRRFVTFNLVQHPVPCLTSAMAHMPQRHLRAAMPLLFLIIQPAAVAAAKPHSITFGKWTTVQSPPEFGTAEDKPLALKVRPLLVDAHIKEFTLGSAHEITDRLFAVRRAFRVNDSLPQESTSPPHWQWQLGGWLLVDRTTGRISPINLPDFDVLYSTTSWYRDYAAYCGISDDGKKAYAVVAQINRRKPILKKPLENETTTGKELKDASADSACPTPVWQRAPTRVTFEPAGVPKQTFAIRGHAVDLVSESEDQEEEASK